MKKFITFIIAIGFIAFLSACSTSAPESPGASSKASVAASVAPVVSKPLTATDVTMVLVGAITTVKNTAVYTEETDPNKQLGRPNGYISKTAFSDSRVDELVVEGSEPDSTERGGSVEVYPTAEGAKARSAYIQSLLGGVLGTEYHFLNGGILVRVTGNITPSESTVYKDVVSGLKS